MLLLGGHLPKSGVRARAEAGGESRAQEPANTTQWLSLWEFSPAFQQKSYTWNHQMNCALPSKTAIFQDSHSVKQSRKLPFENVLQWIFWKMKRWLKSWLKEKLHCYLEDHPIFLPFLSISPRPLNALWIPICSDYKGSNQRDSFKAWNGTPVLSVVQLWQLQVPGGSVPTLFSFSQNWMHLQRENPLPNHQGCIRSVEDNHYFSGRYEVWRYYILIPEFEWASQQLTRKHTVECKWLLPFQLV